MLRELFQILDEFGTESIEKLRAKHMEAGQKASGKAYDGFIYEIKETATGLKIDIGGVDYVRYLEHGRGEGKHPPPDKIKQWIRDKGLDVQFQKEYELNSFAYLIGRKIAQEGSLLNRTGSTFNGFNSPVGSAFEKERMEALKVALQKSLNTTIKSDIINVNNYN